MDESGLRQPKPGVIFAYYDVGFQNQYRKLRDSKGNDAQFSKNV